MYRIEMDVPRDYDHSARYVHIISGEYSYIWPVGANYCVDMKDLKLADAVEIKLCNEDDGFQYILIWDGVVRDMILDRASLSWEDTAAILLAGGKLSGEWRCCITDDTVCHTDETLYIPHVSLNNAILHAPNLTVNTLFCQNSYGCLQNISMICGMGTNLIEILDPNCGKLVNSVGTTLIAANQKFKTRAEYEAHVGYNLIGHYGLPSRSKSVC